MATDKHHSDCSSSFTYSLFLEHQYPATPTQSNPRIDTTTSCLIGS